MLRSLGQHFQQLLKVTEAAIRDGMIQIMTAKRDVQVAIPMHPLGIGSERFTQS